jgi:hypothetical protein
MYLENANCVNFMLSVTFSGFSTLCDLQKTFSDCRLETDASHLIVAACTLGINN